MPQEITCHSCHKELTLDEKPGRQDTCAQCNAYLRCCLNCRFYDPSAYNECAEPMAERVVDKEQGNFCDYFDPGTKRIVDTTGDAAGAKKELETLFKKK